MHKRHSDLPLGVSLKSDHYDAIISAMPSLDFFEIHAENYMMPAGPHIRALQTIREHYDISVHGVGLSLGSAEGLDKDHLRRFKHLVEWINPCLVSDHLSWSVSHGAYLNDLLPLPLNEECLEVVCRNISEVQDVLGRQLLVENPSSYLSYTHSNMGEAEFLNEMAHKTGCGLLLDINNIYVSATNLEYCAKTFLREINLGAVKEIHLAGHATKIIDGRTLLIDDHGSRVADEVWSLYKYALEGGIGGATLIEWDSNLPDFSVFMEEADKAAALINVPPSQREALL
ncbi:DUF692 domain-containing protein [Temperatibacter marinus]|uniref:DUF692 domain-containing protein n=1 Tax=Temperatibacter marinus TaxID=1456591 RepID=A0AA52H8C3_9PROT|nr:DUF692 domain-containing protein [Temperatibacter marinus]WND01689.1 DUF692 domain-containing protein [Temperatibacter marinus]